MILIFNASFLPSPYKYFKLIRFPSTKDLFCTVIGHLIYKTFLMVPFVLRIMSYGLAHNHGRNKE